MMKRNHNPNQGDLFSKTPASACPFAAAAARVRGDVADEAADWPIAKAVADMEKKARFVSKDEPSEPVSERIQLQKPAYQRKAEKASTPVAAPVAKKTRAPGAGRKTLDNGKTIRRPISIPAAMWHTIQVSADAAGVTASEFIRRAVDAQIGVSGGAVS